MVLPEEDLRPITRSVMGSQCQNRQNQQMFRPCPANPLPPLNTAIPEIKRDLREVPRLGTQERKQSGMGREAGPVVLKLQ